MFEEVGCVNCVSRYGNLRTEGVSTQDWDLKGFKFPNTLINIKNKNITHVHMLV
jgi:hypothetical protein